MTKRLEAVGCQRPPGSKLEYYAFTKISLLNQAAEGNGFNNWSLLLLLSQVIITFRWFSTSQLLCCLSEIFLQRFNTDQTLLVTVDIKRSHLCCLELHLLLKWCCRAGGLSRGWNPCWTGGSRAELTSEHYSCAGAVASAASCHSCSVVFRSRPLPDEDDDD